MLCVCVCVCKRDRERQQGQKREKEERTTVCKYFHVHTMYIDELMFIIIPTYAQISSVNAYYNFNINLHYLSVHMLV